MRPHDFAGKRLGTLAGLAQCVDVLPVPLALFHQLAFSARRFVEEARKSAALVLALVGGVLLCGCLFVHLTVKCFDVALMRGAAVGKLRTQAIPFGFDLLHPVAKVLKMRPSLLEQLLELVLGSKGALERFDRGGGLVESVLDGKHSLARVACVGLRGRVGV